MPSLGLPLIKAKSDTGARTSSLHAFAIDPFEKDGQEWVRFKIHPIQQDKTVEIVCEKPVCARRKVKNSGGIVTNRYIISVEAEMAGQKHEIQLTLANRDTMAYRMLIGRQAMTKFDCVVDPAANLLHGDFESEGLRSLYQNYI